MNLFNKRKWIELTWNENKLNLEGNKKKKEKNNKKEKGKLYRINKVLTKSSKLAFDKN